MSSRFSLVIVVSALFGCTFSNNAVSPLYVIYQKDFHFSSLTVTAIFATYAIAVLCALILTGRMSDAIGRKPFLIAGAFFMVVSTIVFLIASNTAELFIARGVCGLATGTLTSAGTAALVELEPNHDRQRASLFTTVGFLAGAAIGPLVFGLIAQYLSAPIRTPYIIELVLQGVTCVGIALLPEPAKHELTRFVWRVQRPSVPHEIRAPFFVAGATVVTGWAIGGFYAALSGSLDRQLLHVKSHALAGLVIFIFAFIGGSTQMGFRRRPARTTMLAGIFAAVLGVVLVEVSLLATSAPVFVVATVVCGMGNGLCFMGSLALVNTVAPNHMRAEVIAAYNVVAYFAISVPVIGVGLLANLFGLKTASLGFTIFLLCLAGLTLPGVHRSTSTPREVQPAVGPLEELPSTG